MVRFVAVFLALLGSSIAAAHDSWISRSRLTDPMSGQWCCNHIDCAEIPNGGVREVSGGFLVSETGETIPYTRVIWASPEGTLGALPQHADQRHALPDRPAAQSVACCERA